MDILPNQFKNNEALISETSNLFQRFLFNFIPNLINGIFSLIPSSFYYFLSRTITFTFQSYLLIILILILVIIIFSKLRYRSKYSEVTQSKNDDENTLFEYNTDQTYEIYDEKPIQTNYPNEFMNAFLASIKVFGYLDKPVFHELANQLQTRMLSKDEVLCRNGKNYSNDFITVVDGEVEVYIPKDSIGNGKKMVFKNSNNNRRNSMSYRSVNILVEDEDITIDDEDNNKSIGVGEAELIYDDINLIMDEDELESKYYRLTKVKTGGTLTSLFVILALLVDKNKNINKDKNYINSENECEYEIESGNENDYANESDNKNEYDDEKSDNESDNEIDNKKNNKNYKKTVINERETKSEKIIIKNLYNEYNNLIKEKDKVKESLNNNKMNCENLEYGEAILSTFEYPTMYFKAKKRTTLAVIPEKAFIDLKQKYPSAVSHMIQVILTRFQRVTFLTLYKYLGLTEELIEVEKKVNEFISGGHLQEKFFPPGGLDRLKKNIKRNFNSYFNNNNDIKIDEENESISSSPLNDKEREQWQNDEYYIKNSIYYEITKYIGINDNVSNTNSDSSIYHALSKHPSSSSVSPSINTSNNTSQEFESFDKQENNNSELSEQTNHSGKIKVKDIMINNLYSKLYDQSNSNTNEVKNNDYFSKIELLYFPRGSILLNEGEKYKGLFFVIDGLIEGVSLNKDESVFKMSINNSTDNIQNNHINVSSNKPKDYIHIKEHSIFNKKMELNNRKKFNDRFDNKYKTRLKNLIRKKSVPKNDINSDNKHNYDIKSNDSKKFNLNKQCSNNTSSQYDRSDTGTLDGTTTELTFSTSDHKTLFYIKPGGLSCYFSILNGNYFYYILSVIIYLG